MDKPKLRSVANQDLVELDPTVDGGASEDQCVSILGRAMARSKTGKAISARRRSGAARKSLSRFIAKRERENRLDEWRRGRAVLG